MSRLDVAGLRSMFSWSWVLMHIWLPSCFRVVSGTFIDRTRYPGPFLLFSLRSSLASSLASLGFVP